MPSSYRSFRHVKLYELREKPIGLYWSLYNLYLDVLDSLAALTTLVQHAVLVLEGPERGLVVLEADGVGSLGVVAEPGVCAGEGTQDALHLCVVALEVREPGLVAAAGKHVVWQQFATLRLCHVVDAAAS